MILDEEINMLILKYYKYFTKSIFEVIVFMRFRTTSPNYVFCNNIYTIYHKANIFRVQQITYMFY